MWHDTLVVLYAILQLAFLGALLVTLWFRLLPVDLVRWDPRRYRHVSKPAIVLFYPVLRELEETMRTTFTGMAKAQYEGGRVRVIAIPNADDEMSLHALRHLQDEFDFLEVLPVPATSDPSWNVVWSSWDQNPKAYWWHVGKRAGETALPPKKTRQLVWATYQVGMDEPDALLSYIDADSVIPRDYYEMAAIGMADYDVIQNTNITGNILATWPTSFYAADHVAWDSTTYKHMTAHGKHPFWVLGKGLFFRFSDILEVGGFHPWITIEDPEIGMRLWTNGARLGVVESPLIEEVPSTWAQGVTQRKRWVAGFFQSLATPLTQMGMPYRKRLRARLNFIPCLSLLLNPFGFALGIWAVVGALTSPRQFLPLWLVVLSAVVILMTVVVFIDGIRQKLRRSKPVLAERRDRIRFVLRTNPVFTLFYWLWWTIPLWIGFTMWIRDRGLAWERTVKIDANNELIRTANSDTTTEPVKVEATSSQ